ncbi:NAD-dependent formate dehydrogenase catalytic subunit /NAD-dependent formate dehydrogenase iron-sulfur protein [Aromatoleum tolulyticum]|uniref:NAD-dependent formate dehydrogenase catalytic subunit /NAD-dependent formate dehydrogenase iron-sulfur protein n=1 Tax=Aromatoleum tolulyticum TaxID=34027 RepID=A0A1N6NUL5_9RHOO|nr:formate dehydrogenase subunit alpha [Aromatoleum tolulyticum]SIP95794.1 NAD-dependent formate dehydrogenase catalytic subunit /NAD-dependent formate dehydrogenase iron-sulfur protein [Aromatoleum tolulyticum]
MNATDMIRFELDGREIDAVPGESILQAARRAGTDIPHLCYTDGLRADGNCRACVVEIDGERVLAPSCCRAPKPGMKVKAESERARASQRMVLELLRADVPADAEKADSELAHWCEELGVKESRFAPRENPTPDRSHPGIAVNLAACIQCTRCLRACREEQVNDVIGLARRGADTAIVFDFNDPMGTSSCVGCGECVQACPTGALLPAALVDAPGAPVAMPALVRGAFAEEEAEVPLVAATPIAAPETRAIDSLCPYCGVGCQTTYHVAGDGPETKIVHVVGRDGPANAGRLCVKGRYGFGYPRHAHRLTKPLIRKPGIAKSVDLDPANPLAAFREANWEEALDAAAAGLARIKAQHGPHALAGFGSAKGSNEEAYLFQKLVRTGFGTHNVDHCTRLCHASSVAALLEGIGSGAVSNPVRDVEFADVIVVIGANPAANHPVAASFIKNAVERGAKLILMDPRETPLARHAHRYLQFRPDADVTLLLSLACVIIEEGLTDDAFIAARTEGFDAFRAAALAFPPERVEAITGIPAETAREVARLYAQGPNSMIFWGMGISQHIHGTDNSRCLIALALMTGQIGRRGTGLHPLRGQNNVQGASDAGLIPMMFPDYQRVSDPAVRAKFETLWNTPLTDKPGLTVVEIMDAALAGEIRGMYIEGENPAMSDPDLAHARAALGGLEHLVVQDLFLTETAMLADVILPASSLMEKTGSFTNTDRLVQLSQPVLPLPGDARPDWWIIQQIAQRLGLAWNYAGPAEVFEELRQALPAYAGITWAQLEAETAVVAPKFTEDGPSYPVLFEQDFPTATGRARFVAVAPLPAAELPDEAYPFVLTTGRVLEHWHTGSMTRRANVLDALEPQPWCTVHPDDLAALGIESGATITLATRRGAITLAARADRGMQKGSIFMPFCYVEAAANLLTQPALDPFGKIPEFKYCAARIRTEETVET